MTEKRQPVQQIKLGRVRASIWVKEAKKGPFYSVSFSRAYPAKDGTFQYTSSFSLADLELIDALTGKIREYIHTQPQ